MKNLLLLGALSCASTLSTLAESQSSQADSVSLVRSLDQVVVSAAYKQTLSLPTSASTLLPANALQTAHVSSVKNVSTLAPNFYVPDYGSRMTSAIYIRGIGSRINAPAVSLYVDDIPVADKSAFDFCLHDVASIQILRGPQGTLFGRNSMGGVVCVQTFSPFSFSGSRFSVAYSLPDNMRAVTLAHYAQPSQRMGFSVGAYYEGSNGFFVNDVSGNHVDDSQAAGGRVSVEAFSGDWNFKAHATYDFSNEGAYPYFYEGTSDSDAEPYPQLVDKISAGHDGRYRRNLLFIGSKISRSSRSRDQSLSFVTGLQRLSDRMSMDQDFIEPDIYTLMQKQKLSSVSEEVVLRGSSGFWSYSAGLNVNFQKLKTLSPVSFHSDGIAWLQETINGYFPDLSDYGMSMNLNISDDVLAFNSSFSSPTFNAALFHQSTFSHRSNKYTIGLRLELECQALDYDASGSVDYDFVFSSPRMPISLSGLMANPQLDGSLSDKYLVVQPKLSVLHAIGTDSRSHIYASLAKGYRSGGYNIQMFSELVQSEMKCVMMQQIRSGVADAVDGYVAQGMPAFVAQMISGYLDQMPLAVSPNPDAIAYEPEFSWNYEAGAHFSRGSLSADVAAFFIHTRNQQIARFSENGLGRMMVNAGRSRSFGAEASISVAQVASSGLSFNANYGYTNASFSKFDEGDGVCYDGNRVPFAPRHTFSASAAYQFSLSARLKARASVLYSGAADIYWDEANDSHEGFCPSLGANLSLFCGEHVCVDVFGKNLTGSDFRTFHFVSMNRGYCQKCKPTQVGIDARFNF